MAKSKRLTVTEQPPSVVPAHEEAKEDRLSVIEWGNRAYFFASCGDTMQAMEALEKQAEVYKRVNDHSELVEDLFAGLQRYNDVVQAQLEMTVAERDELENTLQEEALSIAAKLVEYERERLMQDDTVVEETIILSIADRMVADGYPDSVADDVRRDYEYYIKRAWQLAQTKLGEA